MKKLILNAMALVAVCALMASCAATTPVCATSNTLGSKKGETSQFYFMGFAWTNGGGIQQAAQNGGITKISHVDVKSQALWPIIGKQKTIVYGE